MPWVWTTHRSGLQIRLRKLGGCAMAPAPGVDFGEILKDVPPGAWVALSSDQKLVVAFAADMRDAIKAASQAGEQEPIVLRVPLSTSALFL